MDSVLPTLVLASLFYLALSSGINDFYGPNTGDIYHKNYKHPNAIIEVGSKQINIAKYYKYEEQYNLLMYLYNKYQHIVKVMKLGQSIQNRTIFAVEITHNIAERKKYVLKPMFKFVANVRGNDAVGYALMTSLIQYLVYSDGHDPRITRMLEVIDIWIVPSVNPDGFAESIMGECNELRGEGNANFKNLDENFPHLINFNKDQKPNIEQNRFNRKVTQLETEVMINFLRRNPFVLSGNLKGGALVASYPWDSPKKSNKYKSVTPDDAIFQQLALDYAQKNWMMAPGNACGRTFRNGISNGHAWGRQAGSMQDYNYDFSNYLELSFYLGCCKHPLDKHLPFYWDANLESMLSFIERTRMGVYGVVKNDSLAGEPIEEAVINVKNLKEIELTSAGSFWRLLNHGLYDITASAPGYDSQTLKANITVLPLNL